MIVGDAANIGSPLGYQRITGLTTVRSLTIPGGARYAVIRVEGGSVRWRDDGTDPTSTDGMLLEAADRAQPFYGKLSKVRFFETTPTAVLHVSYYQ